MVSKGKDNHYPRRIGQGIVGIVLLGAFAMNLVSQPWSYALAVIGAFFVYMAVSGFCLKDYLGKKCK